MSSDFLVTFICRMMQRSPIILTPRIHIYVIFNGLFGGIDTADRSGYSDILIGAPWADPLGDSKAGETYPVVGRDFTGDSTVSGASADDPLQGSRSTDTRRSELLSDPCITTPEMEAPERYNRGDGSDLAGGPQSTVERDDDRERSGF